MVNKAKVFLVRTLGVACSMIGFGSLAGACEGQCGFIPALTVTFVGLLLIWVDMRFFYE